MQFKLGIKISLSFDILRALIAISRADVPLIVATAYLAFESLHISLSNIFVNLLTVEISTPRTEHLKKINIKNYQNLSEVEKKYDLIFSNQVLEHIPRPNDTLAALKEKLVDDGFMFHKFPSAFLFKKKLSKNYIPKKDCAHPLEHINILNKNCFKSMCKLLNMKIIKIENLNLKNRLQMFKNDFIFNQIILKKKIF